MLGLPVTQDEAPLLELSHIYVGLLESFSTPRSFRSPSSDADVLDQAMQVMILRKLDELGRSLTLSYADQVVKRDMGGDRLDSCGNAGTAEERKMFFVGVERAFLGQRM
jgi:hypothetical protein